MSPFFAVASETKLIGQQLKQHWHIADLNSKGWNLNVMHHCIKIGSHGIHSYFIMLTNSIEFLTLN